MIKDSTSLACWRDCLAMASKVVAKAAIALSGTPSRSAALRQTAERVTSGDGGGIDPVLVGEVATMIWAAAPRDSPVARIGGLLVARRLAGAIDGGDLIGIDKIESSVSRYRLLLLEESPSPSVYSYLRVWVPDPLYNYTGELTDLYVGNCICFCRGLRHTHTWVPPVCYIVRLVSL